MEAIENQILFSKQCKFAAVAATNPLIYPAVHFIDFHGLSMNVTYKSKDLKYM